MSSLENLPVVGILDAGAQYGKVIDRRVRELCMASEIVPINTPATALKAKFSALIISGGPGSVYDPTVKYDPAIFDLDIPIFGICYGFHILCSYFGGSVEKAAVREDGQFDIEIDPKSKLYTNLSSKETVLLTHGDSLSKLPKDFVANAFLEQDKDHKLVVGFENATKKLYGVQFHPEVDLTKHGIPMMRNFLTEVCGFALNFTVSSRTDDCIKMIQEVVEKNDQKLVDTGLKIKVVMLVSGGVDSTVCATLLGKALSPDRILCIHIDNGFMRTEESSKVLIALKNVGIEVHLVDAVERFANATTSIDGVETQKLCETVEPEKKRKIIGDTFIRIADEAILSHGLNPDAILLGQGTLRPDLIESASHLASSAAQVIKTHHNDTALVRRLRDLGKVIEPLKDFHKDEVRVMGAALGLPVPLVQRHPFPGPGLAIRIICADEPFYADDFDSIQKFIDANIICSGKSSPAFDENDNTNGSNEFARSVKSLGLEAAILPLKTVGVQGDGRSYSHVVAINAPNSQCHTFDTLWPVFFQLAKHIPRHCKSVNRVVVKLAGDDFGSVDMKFTPTRLLPAVISKIRAADAICRDVASKWGMNDKVSQMPVILIPVGCKVGCHGVVVRPFVTNDFMTGLAAQPFDGDTGSNEFGQIPFGALREMADAVIDKVEGVCRVYYDLTSKPPGTTEWE